RCVPLARSLPRFLFTGKFLEILANLPKFLRLYWRLFRDRRVSVLAKALLVVTLAYVIWPLDFLPDYIPLLGEIDDVALVLGGLWLFVRLCPPEVVSQTVHEISQRDARR
ncbi:MAG: YkvA family protein, partial [Candidatus Binatia bacterium]